LVRVLAVVLGLGGLALSASGCAWTRAAVYDPEADDGPLPARAGETSDAHVEDLAVVSEDGTLLHARLARAKGATRAVLFCHGTGGNVGRYTPFALALAERMRAHVLVFDYRGYGRSRGTPTEEGIAADARAALEALDRATGVPLDRTVVLGHSLGGAVAISLAARRSGLAGLIVVSSFTSLEDMTRHLTGIGALSNFVPDRWASITAIESVACPKLFLHGTRDPLVPCEQGARLYAEARAPKRFVAVDGEHEILGHELVERELVRFVEGVTPASAEGEAR
jgi:fermentation-respiration switch protein FrsA (DUF1100 family)